MATDPDTLLIVATTAIARHHGARPDMRHRDDPGLMFAVADAFAITPRAVGLRPRRVVIGTRLTQQERATIDVLFTSHGVPVIDLA